MPELTTSIVFLGIILIFTLAICGTIAFTITSNILYKSNNLGTKRSISKSMDGGFIIYEKGVVSRDSKPSRVIKNPVIITKMHSDDENSYINDETFNTLDEAIDSADLTGINWHK